MRIFGKLLPVFRLTRRISCNSIAPRRPSYCGNILQSRCFTPPQLLFTTLRFFGTKSGNSKFFNRKNVRTSRRLYDKHKSKSSECLPQISKCKNKVHLKGVGNILPVALLNQNNASSVNVMLIPINIFEGEDDAVEKTLATLTVIRDNSRQIEAFTNNLLSTHFITTGAIASPKSECVKNVNNNISCKSNIPAISETPILNEYETQNDVTFWQNPETLKEHHNSEPIISYDELEESIGEQEANRLQMHDSFDVSSWNDSKRNLFAPVSRSLEEKIQELPISSMQLAFEMDMTNIKDALLKASMEPATPQNKVEGVLAKPKEIRNLKEPTLALTTCFEIVPAPETRKVPLSFNALIQGVVEIDASRISLEDLKNIKIPEFNECITAIAANICSTALQKGFPADCSQKCFSTKTASGSSEDKISNLRIGNTEIPRNALTSSTPSLTKAEFFSTKSNEPKTRNPHIVCVREGNKGCISPGNADKPMFIPSKSASNVPKDSLKCEDSKGSLMSCKAYAKAIEEAAKRREASKKSSNKPKKAEPIKMSTKTDSSKKPSVQKRVGTDPCKNNASAEKKDACKSGDKKAAEKNKDPCKSGDKKAAGDKKFSDKKKDPCKSGNKKAGDNKLAKKKDDSCKSVDKKAFDNKKDQCKSGDKKAFDKKKDPCKSGDKKAFDSKKDQCKSGDKKAAGGKKFSDKKKDPCKSGDKKAFDKKKDPCKSGDKKAFDNKKDPCKSGDKKAFDNKKDQCKSGDKKAFDKKKDPCKSGDKKAFDSKKDPCKSGDKKAAGDKKFSDKKKDPCKSGDKKAFDKKKDPCKSGDKKAFDNKKDQCKSGDKKAFDSKKDPCKSGDKKAAGDKKFTDKKKDPCKSGDKKLSDKKKDSYKSGDKKSAEKKKNPCKSGGKSGDKKFADKKKDPCKSGDKKAFDNKKDPCKSGDKKGAEKKPFSGSVSKKSSCGSTSSSSKKTKKNPCEDSKKFKSDKDKKPEPKGKDPCKNVSKKSKKSKDAYNAKDTKNDKCDSEKKEKKKYSAPNCPPPKVDAKTKSGEGSSKDKTKCPNSKSSGSASTKPNCSKQDKGKGGKSGSDGCNSSKSKEGAAKKSMDSSGSKKSNPCKKSYSTQILSTSEDSLLKRCYNILYFDGLRKTISSVSLRTFRMFSSKDKGTFSTEDHSKETRCKDGRLKKRKRKDIKKRTKLTECFKDQGCLKTFCKNPPCGQLTKGKRLSKCKSTKICKKTEPHCYPGKYEQSDCPGDKKENKNLIKRKYHTCTGLAFGKLNNSGRQFSTVAIRQNNNENCEGEAKLRKSEIHNEILRITDICQINTMPEVIPKFSEYDVLIRTDSVAISETDLHVFETGGKSCPGITLGHDASGIIVKVGKCIQNLKPGDRVVIESGLSCGICDFCKRGDYNICSQMMYNGFLSKYQVHPADLCHKLPDSVSMEEGCLAGILALGCNACYKAPIKPTSNVLVLGSCPTAISAALCCQAIGANRVCFACTQDKNLELIQKTFDFDCVCYDPKTRFQPLLESICELLRNWPDVVINCAISGTTMDLAIMSLLSCGTCVLAKCDSECASFNAMELLMKNLRIVPSFRSTNMFPTALQLMDCGLAPMGELISECYEWEAAQTAFQSALHESNVGNMKVIVKCADKGNFK